MSDSSVPVPISLVFQLRIFFKFPW